MLGLVDVTDFWAVGDGTTDCRVPVQKAIAFAKVNRNAGIYFPSGDYKFSRANPLGIEGAIDISGVDGFIIAGAGARTRLFQDTPPTQDWHLIRIFNTADRVVVRDLMLDGSYRGPQDDPGVTEQHHLIRIGEGLRQSTHTHQVRVTNCYLKRCRGDAINIIGATNAVGRLRLTANPAAGKTLTIGAITYTFVSAPAAAGVQIGSTLAQTCANLLAAVLTNPDLGDARLDSGPGSAITLVVQSRIPAPLLLQSTLADQWDGKQATFIEALTDEVMIDHNFIYDTYRSGIGVQRGCRKIIIDSNVIVPNRRGVIDFEPSGANVDTDDWAAGNAPQQFIITNNVLVALKRGNTVVTLTGIGAKDRDKYSLVAHNLCLGGGFEGLNVGPLIIDSNIIVGSRRTGSSKFGLIRVWRGCQDVVVSNNYLERPVPDEGEAGAFNTLEFHKDEPDSNTQQPNPGETVQIGATVYTFKGSVPFANDVLIGSTLTKTCANLVAAILGGPGAGVDYGASTVPNPAVMSATSDGDSILVVGVNTAVSTSTNLAAGFWRGKDGNMVSSAGPLIEVLENNKVQPTRVTIVNNHGRQFMPASGINLTSVSNAMVRGNQLHCYHSAMAGNGIAHDANAYSDQVHIHGNQLMTHGSGRWNHGIHLADAANLGHSSVCDNAIDGAAVGIQYESGPPKQIPTVSGNRVSRSATAAYRLPPTPTCTGGNHGGVDKHGGVAQYEGDAPPSFVATTGSMYLNRNGVAGTGGKPGTLRYLRTDLATWIPLIDG